MSEEIDIILGWRRERDFELIVSAFDDNEILVGIEPGDIPFIGTDDIVVREIDILQRYWRTIRPDESFIQRHDEILVVISPHAAEVCRSGSD